MGAGPEKCGEELDREIRLGSESVWFPQFRIANFLKRRFRTCHVERRASTGEAGIKRKLKHPENVFLPHVAAGSSLKNIFF